MKNTLLQICLFILISLFLLSSCATFDVSRVKDLKNVALLSIYCDKRLSVIGFKGMAATMSWLAQNDDFDLQPASEHLKNKVLTDFASSFPFSFIAEESIITSNEYTALNNNPFAGLSPLFFAIPRGYKIIAEDKDTINRVASGFPGADGFMFINVNYQLRKTFELLGVGTAVIHAQITMTVRDRSGSKVMQKNSYASSRKKITFVLGGVFDANELKALCEEATVFVLENIAKWIKKELS